VARHTAGDDWRVNHTATNDIPSGSWGLLQSHSIRTKDGMPFGARADREFELLRPLSLGVDLERWRYFPWWNVATYFIQGRGKTKSMDSIPMRELMYVISTIRAARAVLETEAIDSDSGHYVIHLEKVSTDLRAGANVWSRCRLAFPTILAAAIRPTVRHNDC
jgi:hypothetical protein